MSTSIPSMPFPQLTKLQLSIMRVIAVYNIYVCVPARDGDKDFDQRVENYQQSKQLVEWGLIQESDDERVKEEIKKVSEQTGRLLIAYTFTPLGEAMFGSAAIERVNELPN